MPDDDKNQALRMLPIAVQNFMLIEVKRKRIPSAKRLKKFTKRYVDAVLSGVRRVKAD